MNWTLFVLSFFFFDKLSLAVRQGSLFVCEYMKSFSTANSGLKNRYSLDERLREVECLLTNCGRLCVCELAPKSLITICQGFRSCEKLR